MWILSVFCFSKIFPHTCINAIVGPPWLQTDCLPIDCFNKLGQHNWCKHQRHRSPRLIPYHSSNSITMRSLTLYSVILCHWLHEFSLTMGSNKTGPMANNPQNDLRALRTNTRPARTASKFYMSAVQNSKWWNLFAVFHHRCHHHSDRVILLWKGAKTHGS